MEIRMACQIVEWERRLEIEKEKEANRRPEKYSPRPMNRSLPQGETRSIFSRFYHPIVNTILAFHL